MNQQYIKKNKQLNKKTPKININKTHRPTLPATNDLTQPQKTTNEMVDHAWACTGHLLQILDSGIRKNNKTLKVFI